MENLTGLELAMMAISGLIVLGLIAALITQIVLIVKYKQFNKTPLSSGLTSQQTARALLDANGLENVQIKKLGLLRRLLLFGNHYSVMKKTIFLRKNYFGFIVSDSCGHCNAKGLPCHTTQKQR